MSQAWLLVGRGLPGGPLVTAFAMLGEMTTPKRFACVFAAAPAVAMAGMTVTAPHEGSRPLAESALGMIAGAVAPVAHCAVAVPLVRRLGALGGSLTALVVGRPWRGRWAPPRCTWCSAPVVGGGRSAIRAMFRRFR